MAVEIEVVSGRGGWEGSKGAITGYSYKEASTPLAGDDSSGATPSFTVGVSEDDDVNGTFALLDAKIKLQDDLAGNTVGVVRSISSNDGAAGLEIESVLSFMNADVLVAPFAGTLGGAIAFYMGLAGIGPTEYSVDASITNRSVTLPGWGGPIWDHLKQLAVAEQIEIAAVNGRVIVRPVRQVTGNGGRDLNVRYDVDNTTIAKNIEIYCYNNTYLVNAQMYPSVNEEGDAFSVGAGEVVEQSVPINAYAMSLAQPEAVGSRSIPLDGGSSYVVIDKDGKIVSPSAWKGSGGSVSVALGDSPNELVITVVGAALDARAPFRIAMPVGDAKSKDTVPSLSIAGTGVFYTKEKLTLPTGADPAKAVEEVGITIDNPFISNMEQAFSAGVLAAKNFSGRNKKLTVSATSVADIGINGSIVFYPYAQFQSDESPKTYAQFQAGWAGKTYDAFQEYAQKKSIDQKLVQAFGNVSGARIPYKNSFFRIREVTYTEEGLQYTAESDTIGSDFTTKFAGVSYDQFQAMHAGSGRTYNDFSLAPLYRPSYWGDGDVVARNYHVNPQFKGPAVPVNQTGTTITIENERARAEATSSAAVAMRLLPNNLRAAAVEGQTWYASADITNAAAGARNLSVNLRFYDAAPTSTSLGTLLGSFGASVSVEAGGTQRLGAVAVAPAGTQSVVVAVNRNTGASVAGDVYYADNVYLGLTDTAFFSGDTPNDNETFSYYWNGTPNASISRKVARVYNP